MPGKIALILGGALTLTGCVGYVRGPDAGVYVAPPVVEVDAPADYIYYPGYNVYYNSGRHEFAYIDGGVWVSRPEPVGVSIDVVLGSPSVRMDFHDSPANHNEAIVRQYPRNWASSDSHSVERSQVERAPAEKSQVEKPQMQKVTAQKTQARKPSAKPEKRDEHKD